MGIPDHFGVRDRERVKYDAGNLAAGEQRPEDVA
jgi:hypothetical protein